MSIEKTKKTNKKTLIIIGVIAVLAIFGTIVGDDKKEEPVAELTQKQNDSIALKELTDKGRFEAEVKLRTYIKSKLNDPKSFDVLNQKSWAIDSTIIVSIEYTAKNGFGGTVRNTIQAEADVNGNLTKVFE